MKGTVVNFLSLPCRAEKLVPHRPPMLIVDHLLERQADRAMAEATVPQEGIWVDAQHGVLPEYYIELIAQTMAAVTGCDVLREGRRPLDGFLVGIDTFCWEEKAVPGEHLWIEVEKTFEFGAVKIIRGMVRNGSQIKATGEIKIWEGDASTGVE